MSPSISPKVKVETGTWEPQKLTLTEGKQKIPLDSLIELNRIRRKFTRYERLSPFSEKHSNRVSRPTKDRSLIYKLTGLR